MNSRPDESEFLPVSIEAEQYLLGAVLLNNDVFFTVAELVDPEIFSEGLHGELWTMIAERIGRGERVTPVTLNALLGKDTAVQFAPDMTVGKYVARLAAEGATSTLLAPDYAKMLRDLYARRRLLALAHDLRIQAMGGVDGQPIEAVMDEADQELAAIRFGKQVDGVLTLEQALTGAIDHTAKVYQNEAAVGLGTGIEAVDRMIGPMMPGNLITLLGASGHGKTALLGQILQHNASPSLDAHQGGKRSLFFSMEMEGVEIARRAIAAHTGISTQKQTTADILPAEYEFLADGARKLAPLPILIDQTPGQTVSKIVSKARAIRRKHKDLALIAVDHLLEIRPENPKWSKIDTVEHAVRELKRLAKELQVVLLLLVQATREGQKRDHWRLRTSDIWGGDSIKQASDMVLAVSLPSTWLAEREPDPEDRKAYDAWVRKTEQWRGRAEIGAPKVRGGESGCWATIAFDGPRTIFTDL